MDFVIRVHERAKRRWDRGFESRRFDPHGGVGSWHRAACKLCTIRPKRTLHGAALRMWNQTLLAGLKEAAPSLRSMSDER